MLVVHNVRSALNVGSLLRSSDGLGIEHIFLSGYTPYPVEIKDARLPHQTAKIEKQIRKTALGAEKYVSWTHQEDITQVLKGLKEDGYELVALEQTNLSIPLDKFKSAEKTALVVGSEVGGLDEEVLKLADRHVMIPMSGKKESYNVSVAAAIALYHLKMSPPN
jgi:23S rRNA (guanosine2251-2'-O)-methyltransferase